MKWKFWQKDEYVAPTREEKDAAKLAEYQAFDTAVGAVLLQGTLRTRFQDAVFAGHTKVVADTIAKGLKVPNELTTVFLPPFGDSDQISTFTSLPLEVAVRNEWRDMVSVLVPVVNDKNLEGGLSTAEYHKDADSAKAIRAEIGKRAAKPAQPAAA